MHIVCIHNERKTNILTEKLANDMKRLFMAETLIAKYMRKKTRKKVKFHLQCKTIHIQQFSRDFKSDGTW